MEKYLTEISASASLVSTIDSTEKRSLSEVMHTNKRPGGNYGSLAKSQLQPNQYISHQVQSDDTLQRLALKYSGNVRRIHLDISLKDKMLNIILGARNQTCE